MPQDFSRADRVGDTLQRELATLIQQEVRDPRVGMVNINAVRVSKDLGRARVFVTYVEQSDKEAIKQSIAVLNKASGFLRSQLHSRMTMRVIPKLHFEYDESIMRAAHLTDLIDSALKADSAMKASNESDIQEGSQDSSEG
jgi:ribosome-binding factor A|tara:strand:+ start:2836 stop:3258 length:423 start_codon:yes stop_codon:yes gene_type:complete